jgi:hypothetical protein
MRFCSLLKWVLIAFVCQSAGFANDVKPVPNYPPQELPTDKASAVSGAANHGHGSHAAEAVASAHQAGQMAKLLAMKSFVDYMQRQQMEKALADLGKKLERVRGDVKSGIMTPAEYAAVQAAVNAAYEKGAKANLPADKDIDKSLLKSAEIDSLKSNNQPDLLSQGGVNELGLEKKSAVLGSDIAQIDANRNPFKLLSNEKNTPSSDNSFGGQAKQGVSQRSSGMSSPALFGLPAGQGTPVNQVSVQAIVHNDNTGLEKSATGVGAKLQANRQNQASQEDFLDGLEDGESFLSEASFTGGENSRAGRSPASLMLGSDGEASSFKNSFRKILRPIKIQKNPFSTKLQSEDGIHPGLLLLLLLLAFVGGKALQRKRKNPVIIPEVILTPEISMNGKNRSKSLVASKRS